MADDSGEIVREAAESVAFANVKAAGIAAEAAGFYAAQGFAESLANTQATNSIRTAIVSRAADQILGSTSDAVADLAAAGMGTKALVNTPPVGTQGNPLPS